MRELKPRYLTKYQRFEADAIKFRKYPAALEVGIYPVSSLSYDLLFGFCLGFPTWCLFCPPKLTLLMVDDKWQCSNWVTDIPCKTLAYKKTGTKVFQFCGSCYYLIYNLFL